MTAVAFAATKLREEVYGDCKKIRYKLQLPEVWAAAGVAWDLSDDFDYIYEMRTGVGDAVTDFEQVYNLIGTYDSDGLGITASTAKIVAHWGGGAGAALDATADSTDLKGVANLIVTIEGA